MSINLYPLSFPRYKRLWFNFCESIFARSRMDEIGRPIQRYLQKEREFRQLSSVQEAQFFFNIISHCYFLKPAADPQVFQTPVSHWKRHHSSDPLAIVRALATIKHAIGAWNVSQWKTESFHSKWRPDSTFPLSQEIWPLTSNRNGSGSRIKISRDFKCNAISGVYGQTMAWNLLESQKYSSGIRDNSAHFHRAYD
jgi:hypothetical protein